MFGRMMNSKKMEEKLDTIVALTTDVKMKVSLLEQSHDQVKQGQAKVADIVDVHSVRIGNHSTEIEKLSTFSASHNKNIKELSDKVDDLSSTQQLRQPFWNALGKITDRLLYLVVGAAFLYFVKTWGG